MSRAEAPPGWTVTAVVAAILTPPDVVSQTLLLLPLLALYEISVLIARFVKSREAQAEA